MRYTWRDRLADACDTLWYCKVRHHHIVKMDSYPLCYRCGRKVR